MSTDDSDPTIGSSSSSSYNSPSMFLDYANNLNLNPNLNGPDMDMTGFPASSGLDDLAGVAVLMGGSAHLRSSFIDNVTQPDFTQSHAKAFPVSDAFSELINPAWPRHLPNYTTLHHL